MAQFFSITINNILCLFSCSDQISLVVNVASECGYTRLNYESLVALQKDYPHEIFNVLGFPCNQFGNQEPNNEQTILNHVKSAYSVNFPMFSKVSITGSSQSPVYSYLIGSSGSTPQWNFSKYLVNQDGDVVQYFSHTQSFDEIRTSLDYLISK